MADGRAPRGLPLLSGPAPSQPQDPDSCRKCGKEFNIIFSRSRKCNHCGFMYCHNCSDYQALMPRTGPDTGYDVMNVCGYCIEYLTITAGGRSHLKTLPIAKLRKYANAYDINITRAVEKDDIIDALVSTRTQNGCLPRLHEVRRNNKIPLRRR
ncbi:hypothetical protein FA13DRAFT_1626346 [Coprinellus micaceus]|uniref:FYVE-type domain-containing protein n=1 Tax=Coprinellus micaceus TaxID=71717 RepID=A0A4Y7TJQ4_COPMI|nr:hypothetical protein FA13DRAFT_1626346 [Coprinellus micaceus]